MDFLTEILGTKTKVTTKYFKKREIIQKQGFVSKNGFYVKKGLIRSILWMKKVKNIFLCLVLKSGL